MSGARTSVVGPILAIARTAVLRLLRDRSNFFFVFVFPALLIVLIGLQFGGGGQGLRLAVHVGDDGGRLADELVDTLSSRDDVVVDPYETSDAAVDSVSRGITNGALLLPGGYDAALRRGSTAEVGFVATPDSRGPALRQVVAAVVSDQAQLLSAATLVVATTDTDFDTAIEQARTAVAAVPGVAVDVDVVGVDEIAAEFDGLGQFDLGAAQQLALFVFVTSLSAAAALIRTRELGVAHRLLAAPVTTTTVVLGELAGRFGVAMLQGLYIMLGTSLVFGVRWGDPFAAGSLLVLFALVCAGAAMLLGALLDTASQAAGVGVGVGLGVSALGGSMAPIEIFPPTMERIAHATPHAWLLEGIAELVRRGGGIGDVLPQLGVLAAMATVLVLAASALTRRRLTTA